MILQTWTISGSWHRWVLEGPREGHEPRGGPGREEGALAGSLCWGRGVGQGRAGGGGGPGHQSCTPSLGVWVLPGEDRKLLERPDRSRRRREDEARGRQSWGPRAHIVAHTLKAWVKRHSLLYPGFEAGAVRIVTPTSQRFCGDRAWEERAAGPEVHPNGRCLLSSSSLFASLSVFPKVTADTELANTEPSGGNTHAHVAHKLKSPNQLILESLSILQRGNEVGSVKRLA